MEANKKKSYYIQRMEQYGITPDINIIDILKYDIKTRSEILVPHPIFKEHPKGIEIIPYTLHRFHILYNKDISNDKRENGKPYSIIRLYPEITKLDGSTQKYFIPKGQSTPPFITPGIIKDYEAKNEIPVLYITAVRLKIYLSQI